MRIRLQLCSLSWLAVLLTAGIAEGRTLHVSQDGPGAFATIQDAIRVARSGDVIEIGPGKYDDYRRVEQPGGAWDVCVDLRGFHGELTLMGQGIDETFIGPAAPTDFPDLGCGILGENSQLSLNLRGITFQNLDLRGVDVSSATVDVRDCRFAFPWRDQPADGIGLSGMYCDLEIENCVFDGVGWGIHAEGGRGGVTIARSQFLDCGRAGITLFYPHDPAVVEDCTFSDTTPGPTTCIEVYGCSVAVARCALTSDDYGVRCRTAFDLDLQDNLITLVGSNARAALSLRDSYNTYLKGRRNMVSCESGCGMDFDHSVRNVDWHDNDFACDTNAWYVVTSHLIGPPTAHLDMSGNYWGTTDTTLIDARIFDANDVHEGITIDYLPLADGPTPTAPMTWGAVKALFE